MIQEKKMETSLHPAWQNATPSVPLQHRPASRALPAYAPAFPARASKRYERTTFGLILMLILLFGLMLTATTEPVTPPYIEQIMPGSSLSVEPQVLPPSANPLPQPNPVTGTP